MAWAGLENWLLLQRTGFSFQPSQGSTQSSVIEHLFWPLYRLLYARGTQAQKYAINVLFFFRRKPKIL